MISVCMTTYNGEKFIREQIDSILTQLEQEDELIISDDGSTDNTLTILSQYTDSRIKVFKHEHNPALEKEKHSKNFYYATENFENALKKAKGEYIFLSDQDDVWLPHKKEIMLSELQNYDCVMCNFSTIDEYGVIKKEKWFNTNPVKQSMIRNIIHSGFLGCCMAFSKDLLQYALPFPEKLCSHDGFIGCLALKKFNFSFIDIPLHLYRRTDSNVSTMTKKSENPLWYKILYRIKFLYQLIYHLQNKKYENK